IDNAVPLTHWFVICVLFLSLFLAVCKRRGERLALEEEALRFRPVLGLYSIPLLDKLIALTAGGCALSYTPFTQSLREAPMWKMLTTIVFVLFGIFRYLHLVYNQEAGEAPESVLTSDVPLLGSILLWGLALVWVYFSL